MLRKLHTPLFILSTIILSQSANALSLQKQQFNDVEFVVVEVSQNDNLKLFWKNPSTEQPYQSLTNLSKELLKDSKKVLFATNSGIFSRDQSPLGWHMENGERLQALNQITRKDAVGNFSLIPNGVFFIDDHGKHHVLETEAFLNDQKQYKPIDATQSGPMLLINDKMHPKFFASSDSLKYRSGVCVRNDKTYFAITQSPINFYYFAKFFQDHLQCKDALYLDGTLSQLYYDGKIYGAPFWYVRPYVGIWAVTKP